MTTLARNAPVGVWQRVARFRARWARWRLYRQTLSEMAGLPDRDLADLGLHRSELKRMARMAVYRS